MNTNPVEDQAIILVSHVTDLSGPTEALCNYLIPCAKVLDLVYHPLHYCEDRHTHFARYFDGEQIRNGSEFGWKLPPVLTFIRDALLTILYFFRFRHRYDLYIGVDPLNCFVGILLKWIGLVDKVYFYTIDWMPSRFENRYLNNLYHLIDRFCVRFCDVAWNISPAIVSVRREQGLAQTKNIYVPVGVELEKISPPPVERKSEARSCVLLGALAPSKGPDLIIEAWPIILEKVHNVKLYVIGKTPLERIEHGVTYEPYEPCLIALGPSVELLGVMSHDEVLKTLPQFDIGLALYKPDTSNLSAWADPSRVKDYLACGLVTVITEVPQIGADIEQAGAGVVVEYTATGLADAVVGIVQNPVAFRVMRENALKFMEKYNWKTIFDRTFEDSRREETS